MIPERAFPFLAEQWLLAVGSMDAHGGLRASVLFGDRGLVSALAESAVVIDRTRVEVVGDDPLWSNLAVGADVGLLAIDEFYDGGRKACLLERLSASVDRARFRTPLQNTFAEWMSVLAGIGRGAGLSDPVAKRRAEDAVVRIEGALVVAAGMKDTGVFARTLDELRATFLSPWPPRR